MVIVSKARVKEDEKIAVKGLRRADAFSRMAVVAALRASEAAGADIKSYTDTLGIIVATRLGPHATTFGFLDGILDFSEAEASPTAFSHSVHNAAASYISIALGCQGPTITVTSFETPFKEAMLLAESWLREGRVRHVLAVYVEERSRPMDYIHEKTGMPAYGRGEDKSGAYALLLTREGAGEEVDFEYYNVSPLAM